MQHYVVCKQTKRGLELVIEGKPIFIDAEENKSIGEILELVKALAATREVASRKIFVGRIRELADQKLSSIIATKRFTQHEDGQLYLVENGSTILDPIPSELANKILEYIDEGLDVEPLANFWKNLKLNPDPTVVKQVFGFLIHNGHPITDSGYFIAYKAVNLLEKDQNECLPRILVDQIIYTSMHRGPFGQTIQVGMPVTMPREKCDSDPNRTCSMGLHVGSMEYVGDFGYKDSVVLEVLINPMNVVAVPTDYNNTKMRVCEYYPYAISNREMTAIYLETDYANFNKEEVNKRISELIVEKEDKILELEKSLEGLKVQSGKDYI